MEPANTIIKRMGGAAEVAKIAGVQRASVYKWTWSKDRGGTGGLIPMNKIADLIAATADTDCPLTFADFAPRLKQEAGI